MTSPYLAEKRGRSMDKTRRSKIQKAKEKLENTYRLDPPRFFNPCRVNLILQQILDKYLKEMCYDARIQPKLTKTITEEIKGRMKSLNYQRYRYVIYMTVGEKKCQGLRVASRCVWDAERDNFASVTYETKLGLFAVASVYAVYYE